MTEPTAYTRTFGVHPLGIGFGWVVCEGRFKLVEAGLFTPIGKRPRLRSIDEFKRLLERFKPAELVLEAFDPPGRTRRSTRARKLGLNIVEIAADRGLSVEAYTRASIQQAFADIGATTREEIAQVLARHFSALSYRLPPKRQAWDGEDRRFAIFNAAAVVIAHFHNGATALLNDMRNAA
jgi:Holliday junction resolvasome RuvABC endonuclease subunit